CLVDLDTAPVYARGMVEYETEFFLLRPARPGKGAVVLFYEVNNRGRKLLPLYIEEALSSPLAALNDPRAAADMGMGFTLARGYTLVWSGWDPDAPTAANGMTTRVPIAMEKGRPVVRRIREEIVVGTRGPASVEVARLAYPAATTDKAKAHLAVRARQADPRTQIPASGWDFVDARSIRLNPPGTKFT